MDHWQNKANRETIKY